MNCFPIVVLVVLAMTVGAPQIKFRCYDECNTFGMDTSGIFCPLNARFYSRSVNSDSEIAEFNVTNADFNIDFADFNVTNADFNIDFANFNVTNADFNIDFADFNIKIAGFIIEIGSFNNEIPIFTIEIGIFVITPCIFMIENLISAIEFEVRSKGNVGFVDGIGVSIAVAGYFRSRQAFYAS